MVTAMNFDNLVAVLAVAAAVPLVLAAVPRAPVPGPVLEIVTGIVLGPAVLDLVQPDQAVRLVSTIGLAFLLFLAGLEIDVRHFRGPRARLTGLALALSALLALIIGIVLHAAGVVESPLLLGIILLATSLGLIVPILEDAGVADRPVGQFAIAGASLGELSPVVLLSLFFSGRATAIGPKLLLLSLLGVLVVLVVIGTLRIERSMWITRMINKLADTSAQVRIRLSVLLVVGLGALATHLGFEAILGAFIAGAILRLVDSDAEHKHPLFHPKLDAIGYGFLIPVFFVASGLTFNLSVLFSSAFTLLRVPLFLLALLVVRGLPAVLYRSALGGIRDVAAVGLLQATSLPFIVAATTIGLQVHAIRPANAAALVAAGLFSVIIFPVISLQLLRSSAQGPEHGPRAGARPLAASNGAICGDLGLRGH
jgi:Kef-type K+ transport system membrane component KefB